MYDPWKSPITPISGLKEGEYVSVLRQRAPDAQAALTVLGRRPLSDSRPDPSEIGGLDLTRTDLRRASLKKADLSRADLWRAHLEGADLYDADLRNSNLREANLDSFQPGSPDFRRGTDLRLAKLNGAKLQDARSLDIAVTEGATADGHTIWPGGFDWRAAGVRLVD